MQGAEVEVGEGLLLLCRQAEGLGRRRQDRLELSELAVEVADVPGFFDGRQERRLHSLGQQGFPVDSLDGDGPQVSAVNGDEITVNSTPSVQHHRINPYLSKPTGNSEILTHLIFLVEEGFYLKECVSFHLVCIPLSCSESFQWILLQQL